VRPFPIDADVGGYWLTWLKSRTASAAMQAFRDWLTSVYPGREAPAVPTRLVVASRQASEVLG
jgi:hypothetical protein